MAKKVKKVHQVSLFCRYFFRKGVCFFWDNIICICSVYSENAVQYDLKIVSLENTDDSGDEINSY